jgi:MtrB/PioB family decaheme-associated outer membrane protein
MTVRYKVLITSILSVTVGSIASYSAMAQDQQAAEAAQPAQPEQPLLFPQVISEPLGIDSWGNIEVGGRYFIAKPGAAIPWNDPTKPNPNKKNMAKFEEYGNVPQGAYLERLQVGGQTKDAGWFADLRADDVGNNNQRYIFDWAKTGELMGNVTYDQTPHVYSTTAMSIWGGAGTNHLTANVKLPGYDTYSMATNPYIAAGPNQLPACAGLDTTKVMTLGSNNGNPTDQWAKCGQAVMNKVFAGAAKPITLAIERDKLGVEQRWTPTPNWDARLEYSNDHRYGTQLGSIVIGNNGANTVQHMDVARPVDDVTQQGRLSTERMGETPWGKYNVKLTGHVSVYQNAYSSFTVENPFGVDPTSPYANVNVVNPAGASQGTMAQAFPMNALMSLMPSNQAYTANLTSGVDLPLNTRWQSTVQYSTNRQDEQFLPFTASTATPGTGFAVYAGNPGGLPLAPASSLHGEVNQILVNEQLAVKIDKDLKATVRYRYYDNHNNTPEMWWKGYVIEDWAANTVGTARRNLDYSYTKQNASGDLTWRVNKILNTGTSLGWEEYKRWEADALRTDEFTAKVFADARFDDIGVLRTSAQYSERRYDKYDAVAFQNYIFAQTGFGPTAANVPIDNSMIRRLDLANRDREKANASFAFDNIPFIPNLSVTPTAGLKFDDYLTDPLQNEVGLTKENSWNAGIEAAYVFKPGTSIMAAYIHENHDIGMVGSTTNYTLTNTGVVTMPALARYSSDMKEDVDTIIVGANVALNDSWDFSASYSMAFGKEDWTAAAYGAASQCAPGTGAVPLASCQPFPTVGTNAQRVDAVLKYKMDSELVKKLGFNGDVFWNMKYSWDHLKTDNWQNDMNTPFFWMVDGAAATRNISMAATNPNYDIHAVATSLNFKW